MTFCQASLVGTLFTNNIAVDGNGGAVHISTGAKLEVAGGCIFKDNHASDSGGALACDTCNGIHLRESTKFERNMAGAHGGAICSFNAQSKSIISLESLFMKNLAISGNGGAVFCANGKGN